MVYLGFACMRFPGTDTNFMSSVESMYTILVLPNLFDCLCAFAQRSLHVGKVLQSEPRMQIFQAARRHNRHHTL